MAKANNRIVVMEDSAALLKVVHSVLEKAGFQVETALNGRIGIQKVETFRPALALVDIMMPEMDGFEVARKLRMSFPEVKVVMFSAQPAEIVEKKAIAAGAELFLQKPVREPVLVGLARKFCGEEDTETTVEEVSILPHESDQPYLVHVKACYICGYHHVNVFVPIPNTYYEDWSKGLFPMFSPAEGFQNWDFLRNQISVCPSCLFSSMDPDDFAMNSNNLTYPYKFDAKKILARNIAMRKKMIDSVKDLDLAFSNPNRNIDLTLKSFHLAEKCGNGLVLGDKEGIYADIGYYSLLQSVLRYTIDNHKHEYHGRLRESLNMFLNQLKVPGIRRNTRTRAYYFIIALHMALGESIKANEMKQQLERFYTDYDHDDASAEERIWNERLLHIWKNGVDAEAYRELT